MSLEMSSLGTLYGLYAQNADERQAVLYRFAKERSPDEKFVDWLRRQDGFQHASAADLDAFRKIIIESPC